MAAYHAALRDTPFVVICQDAASHKSVVVSCSFQARQLGIDNGMPLYVVSRRWPGVVVVQRDAALEASCCEEIAGVLYRYSPEYDVRGSGVGLVNLSRTPAQRTMQAFDIGAAICRDLTAVVPLSAIAAGLAATEAAARIMARMARPNGVSVCEPGREAQTIAALDTTMLPGLSGQCRHKLVAYGLRRIGQVQTLSKEAIVSRFGAEGEKLYSMVSGSTVQTIVGARYPVGYAEAAQLVPLRAETMLESDINDMDIIIQKVRHTVDKMCFLLKNADVQIKRFTLTIKYSDNKKSQKTVALPSLTNDFLTMAKYAQQAFGVLYQRRVAIRSIMLDTKDVRPDPCQTSLFETSWERKQAALARQIVKVRNENSFGAVVSACNVTPAHLSPSHCGGGVAEGRGEVTGI
jgi:DNA polymerase-4